MPCSEFRTPDLHLPTSRRILFGHGFHPGEMNMEELYEYFAKQEPEDGLDHMIISPEDWALKRRLFEGRENLNGITPDMFGTRGQRLLARYCLYAQQYDLAIQPHGTSLRDSDLAVYGINTSMYTKQVANYLGLENAIIRDEGAEGSLTKSLGLEIGTNSPMLDFPMFYKEITSLLHENANLPQAPAINEYVFIASVAANTARRLRLEPYYEPLEPLTSRDAEALYTLLGSDALQLAAYGWDGPSYDNTTGFRGELIARLSTPISQFTFKHKEKII